MTTIGFFQSQLDPNFRLWMSDENILYIQKQVALRLQQRYIEYIEVPFDRVKSMLLSTLTTWRAPLTQNELLEKVICDFVEDITTDIEWRNRFNHFTPETLYFPGTGLTREDKVKLRQPPKFEFQMRY